METLQVADLELQALEVGSHSQLRLMLSDLMLLDVQQLRLVLSFGLNALIFLWSERTEPAVLSVLQLYVIFDPDLTDEQAKSVLQEGHR